MISDNTEFVRRAYLFILNREPDAEGLKFWLSQLNSNQVTKTDLIKAFVSSKEFHDRTVTEKGTYTIEDNIFHVGSTSDVGIIEEIFVTKVYRHDRFTIKDNDMVLDLGANIGAFSIWAARQANNISIIAYEPHERNFALLQENIQINKLSKVKCFKEGVMGYKKAFVLKDPKPDLNHTYGYSFVTGGKNLGEVNCITLDDIGKTHGNAHVIKMDIEGSEFSVFKTLSENSLKNCRCIAIEYHISNETDNREMIIKKLHEFGFKCDVVEHETKPIGMIFGNRST